ncbi:heterodisulfide reductase-related iron-sulfur binding cluster [Maridesulfovibrio sp.]|uniref:heterodisulfide reductase-related iron-sulfur binding cluster n=1 Tax=unclassified Maridesulfovibrio TaxID=2794999 RepID=UPI003AFFDEA7
MQTNSYFNPGCALSIYKPEMEKRILDFLNRNYKKTSLHKICCRHDPQLDKGSVIINVCAGCDKRFSGLYEGISTISLWEVLDSLDSFEFPDYQGLKMSVHDACPVRGNTAVHQAVRNLLRKMNIEIIETKLHGSKSVCCGDDFYPKLPVEKVHQLMKKRADSMPCDDVCVYCVSCIKSLHIGGKTPRHLVDLLMNESTAPQEYDTIRWHEQLQEYIDLH